MIIQDADEVMSYIEDCNTEILKILDKQLSVFKPGYQFTPSYKAGLSDGKKKYYYVQGTTIFFYKGLARLVQRELSNKGYKLVYNPIEYKDTHPTENEFKSFLDTLKLPFQPRDYQIKAAYDSICNYRQINKMATGSGKSLTQYILVRYFISKGMKVALMVPRIMLVEQMYSDFKDYGWDDVDDFVIKIGGTNKVSSFDSPVTISTWQSLQSKGEIFENIDALIIDECHGAISETESVYEKVIFANSTGARYRLGFTGTIPTEAVLKMGLLGSIGPSVSYVTTRDLINAGMATPVIIKFLFFEYDEETCKEVLRMKYPDETKFFNAHNPRNRMLGMVVNKVSKAGNTIVLVDNVKYGEELATRILSERGIECDIKELKKGNNEYGVYLVNGTTKDKDREIIRNLLESKTNAILIGTSSILSTGINIKNLHNLFLTSGGKSFIQLNQAIGRILRTHYSKDLVKVFDIVDDCCIRGKRSTKKNHRYKHFEERVPIYQEHDYDTTETNIKIGSYK